MKIVAIIPTYKANGFIANTVLTVAPFVDAIYVIDDACPNKSYLEVQPHSKLQVINHPSNKGVGGAMKTGYQQALKDDFDIFIKVDADGQMDASQIPNMIKVLTEQNCDFVKGDRLSNKKNRKGMPSKRLFGNRALSFVVRHLSKTKKINDVTNGFTAISSQALREISLDNLDDRYYFEISMIFELSRISAKVVDIPMPSIYNDEISSLSITDTLINFPPKLLKSYFLTSINRTTQKKSPKMNYKNYNNNMYTGLTGFVMNKSHKMMEKYNSDNIRVLEIGGAAKPHISWIKNQNINEYIISDLSSTISVCDEWDSELIQYHYFDKDPDYSKLKDKKFTRIIASHVLEHLPDPEKVIKQWVDLLDDDGILSIALPCDPGLLWRLGQRIKSIDMKKQGVSMRDYDLIMAREHINPAQRLQKIINYYFDDAKFSFFPIPFVPLVELNLIVTVDLSKSQFRTDK